MDREISKAEQNKSIFKTLAKYLILLAIIFGAYYGIKKLLSRKADASTLVMAKVERGTIENLISASGTVVPYYERTINAPVSTEISSVLLQAGDEVEKGNLIMELDQEFTKLEYDQLHDQLEVRKNNIIKLKLEYDKNLKDLDYRNQIQGLNVAELEAQVIDQKRLKEIGGATAEELEQAELQLKVAKLEKKILENDLEYRKNTNETDKRNLELELQIQEKKLKEINRKLRETSVRAPDKGVITWINEDLGKKLNAGEPIVRIANLDRFKIEAYTSDRNSSQLSIGIPVNVRIEKTTVKGLISSISPAIENNTIQFTVTIDDKDAGILRPNLRVEVFIITNRKDNILKVRNGNAFAGANNQEVFFVENGIARKREINLGLRNSDYVEISGNVNAGEVIIISGTDEYNHMNQFEIKNDAK